MKNNKVKEASRVTIIGFFVNLLLSTAKIISGILGQSTAMLADGFHSMSDFVTDVIVLFFVRISGKESDENHTYGHGKYETFATLLISIALLIVGIGILYDSTLKIIETINGTILPEPKMIALWAALVSILSKEILFWYTIQVGKKINSQSVIANAWHHRSDAFSSIGTAIGISGAIFFGEQWRVLDPIAGVIVSIFIIKVAFQLAKPSLSELMEHSLSEDMITKIENLITQNKNVISYHKLRTRKIGNDIAIDVHILLDDKISFVEAHNITNQLEKSLRNEFENDTYISIHPEPYIKKFIN